MSVCGNTGPSDDDASEEFGASARDAYKEKPASKIVRVFTVLAYLLLVSLGAILLSVYYVCVWKSPELPPLNATEEQLGVINAQTGNLGDYAAADSAAVSDQAVGGSNITVNATTSLPNITTASMGGGTEATTVSVDITTDTESPANWTEELSNSTQQPVSSYGEADSIT